MDRRPEFGGFRDNFEALQIIAAELAGAFETLRELRGHIRRAGDRKSEEYILPEVERFLTHCSGPAAESARVDSCETEEPSTANPELNSGIIKLIRPQMVESQNPKRRNEHMINKGAYERNLTTQGGLGGNEQGLSGRRDLNLAEGGPGTGGRTEGGSTGGGGTGGGGTGGGGTGGGGTGGGGTGRVGREVEVREVAEL